MLEEHRAKKAAKAHAEAVVAWQARRDAQAALLDTARTSTGTGSDSVLLKKGEALFGQVTEAALVEERRGPGHYQGRSQGVSIPIGSIGGRSVRYRVGANQGHFVQGTPTPTAIDHGTVYITDQRVIFQGGAQTRECAFAKLIGFEHDDASGSTTFSVSNRQKPTTIHYGPTTAAWFDFRLDLALAHFRGTVDDFIAGMQQDLDEIDRHRPPDAERMAPAPVAAPPAPVEAAPAMAPAPEAAPPPATPVGTAPVGTAPVGTTPVGTTPVGTTPVGTTPVGTTPVGTTPVGTTPAPAPAPVEADPAPDGAATTYAGWYADPWGQAPYRWWDGTRWTADLHDRTPPT